MLAGVSVDYYTRLERGNLGGVSESVLESLASALQLDEAERAHLFDLARTANATRRPRARKSVVPSVRPPVQRILDAMASVPAFVRNGHFDVLGANVLGEALYSDLYEDPRRPVNHARFTFLDPRAPRFWGDWDKAARDTVAFLRSEAGRNPYDRGLTDLIGELSTRSELFRTLWASHDVRFHRSGVRPSTTRGRPPRCRVRGVRPARRSGAHDARVQRRARFGVGRRAQAPRELGGDPARCPGIHDRARLTRHPLAPFTRPTAHSHATDTRLLTRPTRDFDEPADAPTGGRGSPCSSSPRNRPPRDPASCSRVTCTSTSSPARRWREREERHAASTGSIRVGSCSSMLRELLTRRSTS